MLNSSKVLGEDAEQNLMSRRAAGQQSVPGAADAHRHHNLILIPHHHRMRLPGTVGARLIPRAARRPRAATPRSQRARLTFSHMRI